jgi:hypothetical protein
MSEPGDQREDFGEHLPRHRDPSDAGGAQIGEALVADQPAKNLIKISAKVVSHGRHVTFQLVVSTKLLNIKNKSTPKYPRNQINPSLA